MIDNYKPSLEELTHFGVKGMHWGERKGNTNTSSETISKRLSKLDRKARKIDANDVISGYSSQGYELNKLNARRLKKDPSFKFNKLSKKDQLAYREKAFRKAKNRQLRRGAIEVGVILGAGNVAMSKINASPETILYGRTSVALLAAQAGKIRLSEIMDINSAKKFDKIDRERDLLKKQMGRKK